MNNIFTTLRQNSELTWILSGLAIVLLLTVGGGILWSNALTTNPARGIVFGAAISALVFALIAIWQRLRIKQLNKETIILADKANKISVQAAQLIAQQAQNMQSHLEQETKEKMAQEIIANDLKSLGISSETDEHGVTFRYQGGYFRMVDTDERLVRVYYPCIFNLESEQYNLLTRLLNKINGAFAVVKLTAAPSPDSTGIAVHAFADFLYTSHLPYRVDMLRQILQTFFDAQHALGAALSLADFGEESDGVEEFEKKFGGEALN